MRDPIDELESFDPGAPRNPLPPAEVRRLGERHRRRVGPTLLAASTFSGYEAPGVAQRPTGLLEVVAALCAFTRAGC
ncbi:hypothetical protein LRP67_16895 [Nocardioides sp. cx-169]|uniref:hypothetical protein n=1 Tax=Nocardioides sp. cx-169 TaxID=2899080 RepID=UPI001E5C0DC3|nr:hypothetical protein [Nocardioides sp. cx-169]MCD4535769.1 hypothetical protein [Nocardioides sp. cx-169]